jgi:DNA-binding transcriptional ArsR family regulator
MPSVYRAIADPTRRAILDRLKLAECSVKELTDSLPMTQQAVSQHLNALRAVRLVTSRRVSRESRYRLTPAPLRTVARWLEQYRQFTDPSGHHWVVMGKSSSQSRRR